MLSKVEKRSPKNGHSKASKELNESCEEKDLVTVVESILWKNEQKVLAEDGQNKASIFTNTKKNFSSHNTHVIPETCSKLATGSNSKPAEATR